MFDLILDHKNTNAGFFSPSLKSTGLENEDDPTANTYSIIGQLTDHLPSYLDDNGKYTFKLVYRYDILTCYPYTPLVGYGTSSIMNVYSNSYAENIWNGVTNMPMGDGNYYTNFLAIHPMFGAETYVEWNINATYDRFTAIIGQAGTQTACATCQCAFIIYIDGNQIYSSEGMAPGDYQYVDVDISGGNVLRIETDEYDGADTSDWAIVANPYLNSYVHAL